MKDIDVFYLLMILSYDIKSGALSWKKRDFSQYKDPLMCDRFNKFYAGKTVGTIDANGYLVVTINGRMYKAHRLAWALATGSFPDGEIDHQNGVKSDNRLCNLRVVSPLENMQNRKTNENCTSGFRGVYWNKREGRWRAHIKASGKNVHLGYFKEFDDAVIARTEAESKYGFHSNHGRIA